MKGVKDWFRMKTPKGEVEATGRPAKIIALGIGGGILIVAGAIAYKVTKDKQLLNTGMKMLTNAKGLMKI